MLNKIAAAIGGPAWKHMDEHWHRICDERAADVIEAISEPTSQALTSLAHSFHPEMEPDAVRYLWRHFMIALRADVDMGAISGHDDRKDEGE